MKRVVSTAAGVVSVIFLMACAAGKGPSFPLAFPDDVSWFCSITSKDARGRSKVRKEIFVAEGKKWRLEAHHSGEKTIVFVSDGKAIASSHGATALRERADFDMRPLFAGVYRELPESRYLGRERVGKRWCWRFAPPADDNLDYHFWIDCAKHVPRRAHLRYPDGSEEIYEFSDLPAGPRPAALFDIRHTEPLFPAAQ